MSLKEKVEKHWESHGINKVKFYCNDYKSGLVRSKWFAKYLKKNYEFNSIFEVGIMGGRNLKVIKEYMPDVRVGGLDVNDASIKYAKETIDGDFYKMSAFDIDKIDRSWDIIFTMGVFIHLPPDIVTEFCKKAAEKANTIIHVEQVGAGTILTGPKETNPKKKVKDKLRWVPNISKIYNDIGIYDIKQNKIPKGATSDCTHYVEVRVK